MKKQQTAARQLIKRVKNYYWQKPVRLLPTAILLTVLAVGVGECVRAKLYLQRVEYYKNSSTMLQLHDTVQALQKSVESSHSALYCSIRLKGLTDSSSASYRVSLAQQSDASVLSATIQERIRELSPPPAYHSVVEFLPLPKQARVMSKELAGAAQNIQILTQQSVRSTYCLELSALLQNIYFIEQLSKPEGVNAMIVGQLENYQIKVQEVLDTLVGMKFPELYADQHNEIAAVVSQLTLDLRQDDNDASSFARYNEVNKNRLLDALQSIETRSKDLQDIPQNIALQASYLH